jgi:hypothetical protein
MMFLCFKSYVCVLLLFQNSNNRKIDDNVDVTTELKTNTVLAEHEGLTPLIPKSAIGHNPESVPSTSHPHNLPP